MLEVVYYNISSKREKLTTGKYQFKFKYYPKKLNFKELKLY